MWGLRNLLECIRRFFFNVVLSLLFNFDIRILFYDGMVVIFKYIYCVVSDIFSSFYFLV